jgi:protein-L-isoaspartate(D-aspartate) O-methyltransferase
MHWPHLRRSRVWSTRRTMRGEAGPRGPGSGEVGPGEIPTTGDGDPWAAERSRMVDQQLIARGIDDPELVRAFRTVPRHAFVESDDPYSDRALAIDAGQTISQPYVVAEMIRAAWPDAGWRGAPVLEIGTGSGYSAAILAELGATVTTVERYPELAAAALERLRANGYTDVHVVVGDGTLGWPAGAPYDAIIVTAAGPIIPPPLQSQLSPNGGKLVMPVGEREHQVLTVLERNGNTFSARRGDPVVFVPLVGEHGFRQ